MGQADEEIPGMNISINAMDLCTDIPNCMTAEARSASTYDEHIIMLSQYILFGWP